MNNESLPIRVLQFGGGNFLRGYLDWMVHRLNTTGHAVGRIAVLQSTSASESAGSSVAEQGFYHLLTRGVSKGDRVDSRERVECIAAVLHASREWSRVLELARSPELRFVFSNTTEAGIATSPDDAFDATPPRSFPAKLTRVLYERFASGESRGLVVVPCELIAQWNLPADFARWIDAACVFVDTLVDRIVPGKPSDAPDPFAVVAEPFCQLFLQSPNASVRDELPFDCIEGVEAIWTDDLGPYRSRKVRILNGAHTAMAMVGSACGLATVRDCMDDPLVGAYVERLVMREIVPSLTLPGELDLPRYASEVFDRFRNPFVEHKLASIALNTGSKWRTRLLPTLLEAKSPTSCTAFALATFLWNYRPGTTPQDDPAVVERIRAAWATSSVATAALRDETLWKTDLSSVAGLVELVDRQLADCERDGARQTLERLLATM